MRNRGQCAGLAGACLLLGALSACVEGGAGVAALNSGGAPGAFEIGPASVDRATIVAAGNAVEIVPSEGFCIARESLDFSGAAAFAVIGDCLEETGGRVETLPGIITVSVSGRPMFERGKPVETTLEELRAFLGTERGLALLGRDGAPEGVKIRGFREVGNALYVGVADEEDETMPFLAPDFWRAFVELNDRLAMVTLNGFRDRPIDDTKMLGVLARQITALRDVNDAPRFSDEDDVAREIVTADTETVVELPEIVAAVRVPTDQDDAAAVPETPPTIASLSAAPTAPVPSARPRSAPVQPDSPNAPARAPRPPAPSR